MTSDSGHDGNGQPAGADPLEGLDFEPSAEAFDVEAAAADLSELEQAQAKSAEHLADLQRINAEYANFSRRAKRDQEAARTRGIEDVLVGLLPVLDDLSRTKAAGDLTGPFEAIADKLSGTLGRFGIVEYGQAGEEFDPAVHEALMHQTSPDATTTTVSQVIEVGYRIGDRVVRPARVAVVGPEA